MGSDNVKRYTHGTMCGDEYDCGPRFDKDGEFVYYEDFAHQKKLVRVLAERIMVMENNASETLLAESSGDIIKWAEARVSEMWKEFL